VPTPPRDSVRVTVDGMRETLGELGLSQSALAREAGVSRQEVSRWLRGDRAPTTRNLLALAMALQRLAYADEPWPEHYNGD